MRVLQYRGLNDFFNGVSSILYYSKYNMETSKTLFGIFRPYIMRRCNRILAR